MNPWRFLILWLARRKAHPPKRPAEHPNMFIRGYQPVPGGLNPDPPQSGSGVQAGR